MDREHELTIRLGTLWGALYVIGIFVAGLSLHMNALVFLAAADAGACYLAYLAQSMQFSVTRNVAFVMMVISIAIGLIALIVLGTSL